MDLKIHEYLRLIKAENYPAEPVLVAIQHLKGRSKYFPSWQEMKEEIENCLYIQGQRSQQTPDAATFLERLHRLIPVETDRIQASVCFQDVLVNDKNGIVEIHSRGPASFMVTKYGGMMEKMFPNKTIVFVSSKGIKAKV